MNYFLIVLLVGLVILVHETGHFIAAKIVNIPIQIFSVGFGPKLWGFKKGKTEYRLSVIPIGGYVLPEVEDELEFFKLPVYKRIVLAIGGPLANIILSVLCFSALNLLKYSLSVGNIFFKPLQQVAILTYKIFYLLPTLFSHSENLSGIVGIVIQGEKFIGANIFNILPFAALISINLAVLNLLPIPILDGGKILFYLLEKIHPKFQKIHYPFAIAGWIFVFGLMLYTIIIDINRYII